jgi:predicted metal-dependent phosphoesterase TrpH
LTVDPACHPRSKNDGKHFADLHIHSIYSDGSFNPYEIVQLGRRCKLKALALTDHDTVAGVEEALSYAHHDLEVIPAVEMSSNIGDMDIHILGYYIDHKDQVLLDHLHDFKQHRIKRVKTIIAKLYSDGIKLEFEQIKIAARDCSLGRPHVAEVLVENGYVKSITEAFHRYLGYGLPYYVPKKNVPPKAVIRIIKRSRGIPVIAHPGTVNNEAVIYQLIMDGALGIEVWHPDHTPHWRQALYEIALKNGLLMTGGSDCHGRRMDAVRLGLTGCGEKDIRMLKMCRNKMCSSMEES